LDAYVEEALPKSQINEAVKNKRARIVLEQVKEILGVDTALAKKSVKSAIIDGKKQIDEANKKLEAVQSKYHTLAEKYNFVTSDLILEKKTEGLSEKKKKNIITDSRITLDAKHNEIVQIIERNTFKDLTAKLILQQWKKT
jgi:archaellum component FlaC